MLAGGGTPAPQHSKYEFEFEVCTLDGFIKEHDISSVDFIKIDVEGYEADVIEGAKNLLQAQSPIIVLEVLKEEVIDGSCSAIDSLKKFGYHQIYEIRRETKAERLKRILNKGIDSTAIRSLDRPGRLERIERLVEKHYVMILCSKHQIG